jgi:membrane-bound metal-dependent hydrolase YbcI (DUF457 family)
MFVGHYAVALAAKRAAPRTSLGALIAAAILLDLLWPVFVLMGWERFAIGNAESPFLAFRFDHYPWSHSLLAALVWATLVAALHQWRTRYGAGTVAIWGLVVSHWVLDAVVHRPDLPITPQSPVRVGLELWANPVMTVALEVTLLVGGLIAYQAVTRPRTRAGLIGLWVLVGVLLLSYAMVVVEPPDPSMSKRAVAIVGLVGGAITIALATWTDRHRTPLEAAPGRA